MSDNKNPKPAFFEYRFHTTLLLDNEISEGDNENSGSSTPTPVPNVSRDRPPTPRKSHYLLLEPASG